MNLKLVEKYFLLSPQFRLRVKDYLVPSGIIDIYFIYKKLTIHIYLLGLSGTKLSCCPNFKRQLEALKHLEFGNNRVDITCDM